MTKKPLIILIAVLLITAVSVNGQKSNNNVIALILSSYSAKVFSIKPVTDIELEQIVKCGIIAPSAKNRQPWKFTIIRDTALMQRVIPDINDGNILIIVSGLDVKQEGINVDFDCALATQNMYIAAQSLGLGARIYTGPVNNINATMKETLEIPEGYMVISVLRIGNIDRSIDAVSSASPRKQIHDIVNYK